jgi:hypothetical protein
MGVFKKKPGGTVVGNIVRTGANKMSGGILGNGAGMLPVRTSQAVQTATANQKSGEAAKQLVQDTLIAQPVIKSAIISGMWDKYKTYIIAVVILLLIGAFFLLKSRPRNKYSTTFKR